MVLVNVNRDVADNFYRYKMDKLVTKVEGKGNGIKTVVVNLVDVARALSRDPNYVIKYFAFELGAQTNTDPKDDRWIINGAHEATKLQDLLDGFIKKFVLCRGCSNPETVVIIKDPRIILDCKACGHRTEVDLKLKLSGFIIKHESKKGNKKADKKAARRAKKQAAQNGNASGDEGSDNSGENGQNGTNGHDASEDEFDGVAPAIENDIEVRDDEWAVDMSEEAVKARQAQLPDEFKGKLNIDDDEAGGESVYDELGQWIQAQAKEKGSIDNVDSLQVYVKAKEFGIEGKHKTIQVLVQTLFDKNIVAQIPKRAGMIKQIGVSEKHQKALLGGTERLLGFLAEENPDVYPQIVKILQLYYHSDLITEEIVLPWGKKASKKYADLAVSKKVRKAAEPFLTWLEEAEEEESSDEDDE
ncbi:hypothetical protein PWT90_01367 [Aphanocladium album]|nr:hypothetical protein PWT90_01367 [Aphanocladium album]